MGGVCCGHIRIIDQTNETENGLQIDPLCNPDYTNVLSRPPSIFILGSETAGKTILFLRIIYPYADISDLVSVTKPTNTLHVEPYNIYSKDVLLWDVGGDHLITDAMVDALNQIHVYAIIYVVSMLETSSNQLLKERQRLYRLVCHPLAMQIKFLVVLNTFGAFNDQENPAQSKDTENVLVRTLHLQTFIDMLGPQRFRYTKANVKDGLDDPNLADALAQLALNP
ncbi:ADP-ribosylation factor family protein [Gregarina niphandrodes]|uniref:ADP-ribosylation factor family protein n=1 Tax=Gregarina niphandrodes TaxID=110365 RepID=A0A023AYL9_GRENI|nr:ADP-ribosylation factor family protein [Gregarina niphandrodes]EZG43538.1 ADP-ribosylation factor family protein [Gregarina niphandrodes]|eukprot:XP_011133223.1 ADP-ribosylation factor family protein [Gregarina niphandrodes]